MQLATVITVDFLSNETKILVRIGTSTHYIFVTEIFHTFIQDISLKPNFY